MAAAAMHDADIYVKTDAGRDEIKSRTLGLPMSIRAILLMIDGQRTVSAMRGIIAGSKAPPDVLDSLVAQGLIERASAAAAPPPAVPAPAPVPVPSPPVAPPAPLPAAPVAVPANPVARAAPVASTPLFDGPLDLTLPTIFEAEFDAPAPVQAPSPSPVQPAPVAAAMPAPVVASPPPPAVAPAAPVQSRYEHLYAMMNEIVRDFLAPHRRYFFQLKIERCTTADELLELLHDLQTSLAKSRGDAFASDVIARLRGAAT